MTLIFWPFFVCSWQKTIHNINIKIDKYRYCHVNLLTNQVDFGYSDRFGDEFAGAKLPTFEDMIATAQANNLYLALDIKNRYRGGGGCYTINFLWKILW